MVGLGMTSASASLMRQVMEHLLALQSLALDTSPLTLKNEAEILKLRQEIPADILDHFDRLIARGKKGLAVARNGACSECHLRLSSGTQADLAYTDQVHVCENCGRYLFLPADPGPSLAARPLPELPPAKSPAKRAARKAPTHAV
jgi:hypothetical protein